MKTGGEKESQDETDISILTPSYGYGRYIREALESATVGGTLSIEHIVQDAGSRDETEQVLQEVRQTRGDALRWSIEPDKGQSDALNKALAMARGRWIGWLNADEFYLPHGLDVLVKEGEKSGADVVYGDAVFVDVDGNLMRLKPQHAFSEFVLRNYGVFIPSCATIFRRSSLWDRPWDVHLKLVMDHDLYLNLAHRSARFHYVPYPVAAFRVHAERVSAEPEAHGGDFDIVRGRHGQGGRLAKGAAWVPHALYKARSGGYTRQHRAAALKGTPMTWTAGSTGTKVYELLRRCYERPDGRWM